MKAITNFAHESGRRDTLALGLRLYEDPESDIGDPDVAATWGELSIWVGGRNICAHRVAGDEQHAIRWHFLSVFEWLASNWDAVLHEGRLPEATLGIDAAQGMEMIAARLAFDDVEGFGTWQRWWERHCLRAAEDGGLFPNLYLRRRRGNIELSWDSRAPEDAPEGFAFLDEAGHNIISPADASEALWGLLDRATEELVNRNGESERLVALRQKALALMDDARSERRFALMAGLGEDPDEMVRRWHEATMSGYGSQEAREATFGAAHDELVVSGSAVAAVMFGSLAPTVRSDDVKLIASLLLSQYPSRSGTKELGELVRSEAMPRNLIEAWQRGYELAEELHEALAIDTGRFVDVQDIINRLGIDTKQVRLTDPGIRGLSLCSDEHTPTVVINRDYGHGESAGVRRFTLAHELCHVLYDREQGNELAVASGAWAPADIERRANAFAAMFLMPRTLVQKAVAAASNSPAELQGAQEVIAALELPATTVLHHLCNLGFIDDGTREGLFERLQIDATWDANDPRSTSSR
jgi:Zn-dependent peptidase ImmA (M78 family)